MPFLQLVALDSGAVPLSILGSCCTQFCKPGALTPSVEAIWDCFPSLTYFLDSMVFPLPVSSCSELLLHSRLLSPGDIFQVQGDWHCTQQDENSTTARASCSHILLFHSSHPPALQSIHLDTCFNVYWASSEQWCPIDVQPFTSVLFIFTAVIFHFPCL